MANSPSQEELPRFFGKYELLERIGSGGMAEVFLARLPGIGGFSKTVVIKRLRAEMKNNPGYVHMFVEEAKLAAEVQHRNVVQIFELGSLDTGEVYMAMEYVPGTDLKHLLRIGSRTGRRLPVWFGVYVVHELLEALSFAHNLHDAYDQPRNIVHCDVTPENVFLSRLGDVKLGDFGVAVDDSRPFEPFAGQLKGKVPYMSPEQLSGERPDRRSDIFAAGVVLWECLTQRRLFSGETQRETMARVCSARRTPPSELMNDVPPELDACVVQALAIHSSERMQSCAEMQARLRNILGQLAPRAGAAEVRSVLQDFLQSGERGEPRASEPSDVVHDLRDSDVVGVRPASIPQTTGARPIEIEDEILAEEPDVFAEEEPAIVIDKRVRRAAQAPSVAEAIHITEDRKGNLSGGYSIVQPENARDSVGPLPRNLISTVTAPIAAKPGVMETHDVLRKAPSRKKLPDREQPKEPAERAPIEAEPPPRFHSAVGRHPLWVRSTQNLDCEAQSPQEAIESTRELIETLSPGEVQLSTDGRHWTTAASLLELMGHLPPSPMPEGTTPLAIRSLVSHIGELASTRATGVLWVESGDGRCMQLRIRDGKLLNADSKMDPLGPLARGLANPGASGTELASAVHQAIADNLSLHDTISPRAVSVLRPWVVRKMQSSLQHAFTSDRGRAVFVAGDPGTPVASDPIPLLRLLAPVVSRARRSAGLRASLKHMMTERFARCDDFDTRIAGLGLGVAHMSRCRPFGHGYSLQDSLNYAKTGPDTKLALVLAYLMIELGLLRPLDVGEHA